MFTQFFSAIVESEALPALGALLSSTMLFKSISTLRREQEAIKELKIRIRRLVSKDEKLRMTLRELSDPDNLSAIQQATSLIKAEARHLTREQRESIENTLSKPSLASRTSFAKKLVSEGLVEYTTTA